MGLLNKSPKVAVRTMSCKDAIKELKGKMKKFKLHYFLKRVQSNFFQESITSLKDDEAVVQVDFAENYKLISQDETQSAHWRFLYLLAVFGYPTDKKTTRPSQ